MSKPLVTADAVARWAALRPADEPYTYNSDCHCALGQYLRQTGVRFTSVGGYHWFDEQWRAHPIPDELSAALQGWPRTFGALHARLAASVTP